MTASMILAKKMSQHRNNIINGKKRDNIEDDEEADAASRRALNKNGDCVSNLSYSRRATQRLVFKNGECNVWRANIKKRRQRYLADIFTTLVDIKWRWNLLNFVLAFMLSWLIFALAWWLICFSHGDLNSGKKDEKRETCVEDVYDFTTALLFSIETQQTIGYGTRHTNPHCTEAIIVMMCQSCFGVIIQALMTGLVFAKLSRPKKRAETLLFSKHAVICKRDGVFCLLFRVGDMRKSHIVEAHVRAILIRKHVTSEGEIVPLYQCDLKLGDGETEGRLFMVWPVIVEHKIDEDSPFWKMSADDLRSEKFELVVVLEGIVESTGMTTQARTSYLPEEILWGHRFERLVTFQRDSGQYLIDYSKFHWTIGIDMPRCSAKDLQDLEPSSGSSSSSTSDGEDGEVVLTREVSVVDEERTAETSVNSSKTGREQNGGAHGEALLNRVLNTSTTLDENSTPKTLSRKFNRSISSGSRRNSRGDPRINGVLPQLLSPISFPAKGVNNIAIAAFDLSSEDVGDREGGGVFGRTYTFF